MLDAVHSGSSCVDVSSDLPVPVSVMVATAGYGDIGTEPYLSMDAT